MGHARASPAFDLPSTKGKKSFHFFILSFFCTLKICQTWCSKVQASVPLGPGKYASTPRVTSVTWDYQSMPDLLDLTCARVDQLLILRMVIPPLIGNPYNGYINPYYWVEFPIPYMEIMGVETRPIRTHDRPIVRSSGLALIVSSEI